MFQKKLASATEAPVMIAAQLAEAMQTVGVRVDVATVRVPVRLRHGVGDEHVPANSGYWLADNIPGIVAEFPELEDHTNLEDNNKRAANGWLAGLAESP